MGRALMDQSMSAGSERDDGFVSLVLWRLRDPAWTPSFVDLLEDVRTCIHPAAQPSDVLSALRDALTADDGLAPRARMLAIQARNQMARREPRADRLAQPEASSSTLRRLAELRPSILGG